MSRNTILAIVAIVIALGGTLFLANKGLNQGDYAPLSKPFQSNEESSGTIPKAPTLPENPSGTQPEPSGPAGGARPATP